MFTGGRHRSSALRACGLLRPSSLSSGPPPPSQRDWAASGWHPRAPTYVFAKQSLGPFEIRAVWRLGMGPTGSHSRSQHAAHPFSRSYRVMLPSSLAMRSPYHQVGPSSGFWLGNGCGSGPVAVGHRNEPHRLRLAMSTSRTLILTRVGALGPDTPCCYRLGEQARKGYPWAMHVTQRAASVGSSVPSRSMATEASDIGSGWPRAAKHT